MDGRFVTAFILPESWEILGYKLKPFSLRHQMTLLATENPMMGEDVTKVSPADLIMLLRVCSMDDPFIALGNPSWKDKWRLTKMEMDVPYFLRTMIQVSDYIRQCSSTPKTYTKEDGVTQFKKENIPNLLSLVTSLMARMHMSQKEAWGCTLGQAVWYLTAYSVSEGADIKILTTDEEEKAESDREFLVRMQKQALAEHKERMRNR